MARARRSGRPDRHDRLAPPRVAVRWHLGLLLVVAALTYANSLSGPFVFDDSATVLTNRSIETLSPTTVFAPPHETPVAGRPLINLTFAINYALGGREVTGYHVANIAVHMLCGLLVFGVVSRTLALYASSDSDLALAIALIWLVHPLNSEVVNYITQRTESLMALASLLTVYAAIRALSGVSRARWEGVAVLACAAGMACKESMVTAPVVVLLYDRVFAFGSFGEALAARRRLYGGLALGWVVLGALVATSPRGYSAGFGAHDAAPVTYLLNQPGVIVEYLGLAVWPRPLALYYGWPLPASLGAVWPQALALAALAATAVVALARRSAAGFLGAVFFITLAPTSSIVPIATEVGAERRMYLPLVALVALAVFGGRALWGVVGRRSGAEGSKGWRRLSAQVGAVALTSICLALAGRTFLRNQEYGSSLTLAETTVARRPSPGARSMLGTELAAAGRFGEAEVELRLASPAFPPARYYLATVLERQGRLDEAVQAFRDFIRSQPAELAQVHEARGQLGSLLMRAGRTAEATGLFRAMVEAQPGDLATLGLLANALVRQGAFPEAVERYGAYLRTRPDDTAALSGFGIALSGDGRLEEAARAFRRVVQLEPANGRAAQNLARALAALGNLAGAEAEAARAVSLEPDDVAARALLAQIRTARGKGR